MSLRRWILGLSLLCVGIDAARAAVQVDVQLGFDSQVPLLRPNAWAPVTVTIRNDGPDLEGRVRIGAREPGVEQFVAHNHALSLPKNSTKQIREVVFVRYRDQSVDAEWLVEGIVDAKTSVPFQFSDRVNPAVVIVGDADWVRMARTVVRDQPRTLRPILYAARLEDLSDNPFAYDGIDVVVLDQGEWTRLLTAQLDALRVFVEGGGQLVVSTGRATGSVASSPLADFLPVRLHGTEQIQKPVAPLPHTIIQPETRLLVADASLNPGQNARVFGQRDDKPLIAEGSLGLGRVVFLGFQLGDPVLREWSQKNYLWSFLCTSRFRSMVNARDPRLEYEMVQVLDANTLMAVPTPKQVGFLLLAYVVGLIPLNHCVCRLLKRPLWAWWILPGLSLGLGAAIVINERAVSGGNLALTEISIAQTRNDCPVAAAESFFSLQSPFASRFDLRATDANVVWTSLPRSDADLDFQIRPANGGSALSFELARKDAGMFRAAHVIPIGKGIETSLTTQDGKLVGRIVNRSGFHLVQAGVIEPTGSGGTVEIVPEPEDGAPPRPATNLGDFRHMLDFAGRRVQLADTRRRVVFWALASGAPLDLRLKDRSQRSTTINRESRWTLLLCEVPFQVGAGSFEIPAGLWRTRVVAVKGWTGEEASDAERYVGLEIGRLSQPLLHNEVVLLAEPGVDLALDGSLALTRLELEMDLRSTDPYQVELYNLASNSWDAAGASLGRDRAFKYVHPRTGAVLMRVLGGGSKRFQDVRLRLVGERKPGSRA